MRLYPVTSIASGLTAALFVAVGMSVTSSAQAPAPIRIATGLVSGVDAAKPGVRVFKGIPYAAPPLGDLRWRPPQPPAAWTGVRPADKISAACMQDALLSRAPWTEPFMVQESVSEDCLYLNVWAPTARTDEKHPVLVFVHGGGFREGSGAVAVYDGTSFAARGVVVVTINYRLGVFGFFAHPALKAESADQAPGNYGLLDVIAALKWVRDNITAFGGDPGRVTIAGQSAGAAAVHAMTRSPLAGGLFHRAIAQSGSGLSFIPDLTLEQAAAGGQSLAASLGAATIAALRAIPASDVLAASNKTVGGQLGFRPVVDGRVLTASQDEVFAAGRQNDVPMLTGMNADEGSGMDPKYGRSSRTEFETQARSRYANFADGFLALYPAPDDRAAGEALKASSRDRVVASMLLWARQRAASPSTKTPAFTYFFTRAIPWPERPEFGAFHTGEMPYVFGTIDKLQRPWTDIDRKLSDTMMGYWAAFILTGDPNGNGQPKFPAFAPDRVAVMELGEHVGVREAMRAERFKFWSDVFASPVGARLGPF